MASLVIETILKTHKITDYLRSKGIYPDGPERGGKIFYKCPIHEGDNTPSFVVYTQSSWFENYYCYGCKTRYHIVHLYRDLEKVSMKQAIKALANGMVIDDEMELQHAMNEIAADKSIQAQFTPDELSLLVAKQLYDHQKVTEYDPESVAACEKIAKLVDKSLVTGDMDTLHTLYEQLPDVMTKRVQLYLEQKEAKIMKGE